VVEVGRGAVAGRGENVMAAPHKGVSPRNLSFAKEHFAVLSEKLPRESNKRNSASEVELSR
jgi:hypothetical protein